MTSPDDLKRKALLDQMGGPDGNTGISGIGLPGGVAAPPLDPGAMVGGGSPAFNEATGQQAPAPAAPAPTYALGGGFDQGKLADPTHTTDKYQLGRVFQNYDPAGGITPELLADLNKLDIGDFSGSGDRLSVNNARNGGRWTNGTGDVIQNFTGEGAKNWNPLMTEDPDAPQGGAPRGQGSPFSADGIPTDLSPYLQGDAVAQIQKELAALINGDQSPMARESLMRLMGQG